MVGETTVLPLYRDHGAVFREPQGVKVETGGLQLGGYGRRTERES